MARVAALYDIHGNLPALEAALRDVARAHVDLVLIGGDVVPGPMVRACLAALRALPVPVLGIRGNGEREVLALAHGAPASSIPEAYRAVIEWCSTQLTADDATMLAAWPATRALTIEGLGEVLFCHATPQSDSAIFTRETSEAALQPVFAMTAAPVVVCGHTHMPFDRVVGRTRVVNAGSVGMPFGDPRACWLLLGPGVEQRRVAIDAELTARRVRETDYPGAAQFVDSYVLGTPDERAMLDRFARLPLR